MKYITSKEVLRKIFILPIRFYQLSISPLLGSNCRHTPSCSQYTIEAIQEWGVFKGIWLGMKRIARCHPWGTHGYDPVPKNTQPNSTGHHHKSPSKQK
ncbi:membrane protein insertion efficiency factor YidD [Ohtaekwangia kribbensis]|jgi:putative membrane protein insertion efficiency factor|uniref:Putative membrane protein insertion efficiency factor n=1 Tax=Ohtaekwangia kribbensis TaxID=688913 RepID=A0ABW3JXX7_9BACT